jgi:FlaA1/EpsC-like NDP-sugar epimerase
MLGWIERRTRAQKAAILMATDTLLLPVAGLLALFVSMGVQATGMAAGALALLPMLAVVSASLSVILGLPRIQLSTYELAATGRTALFAIGTATGAWSLGALAQLAVPGGAYVTFGLIFFVLSAFARLAMRHVVRILKRRAVQRIPVLIYGAGNTGVQLASALKDHDGIDPVAFADDDPALQGLHVAGLRVLQPARIAGFVAARGIGRVLLAMPSAPTARQSEIAAEMQDLGLEVQTLPSFAQLVGTETLVEKLVPVAHTSLLGRDPHDIDVTQMHGTYAGKSVLVSGAGGSIGSELCRQLLALKPRKLILFELSELALFEIDRQLRPLAGQTGPEIVPVLGTVTDPRQVDQVLSQHSVEVILHAAAYKHVPMVEANPVTGLANNVLGTRTLARAAIRFGVERFILISTDKAVRPASVMGASKRLSELVVQDLAQRSETTVFTMVRFGNVLGSSGSVIPLFQSQIARGGPVTITDNAVTRYFMTSEEAVRLVLRAGAHAAGGEIFVLDMGEPVAIRDLARRVIEMSGYSVRDANNPDGDIAIVTIGLRPGEKLHEELTTGDSLIPTAHPKILTAREERLSEIEVASALRGLRSAIATGDEAAARRVLARWVQDYEAAAAVPVTADNPA